LNQCEGKIHEDDGVAKLLGIKPSTLTTRIQAMGVKNKIISSVEHIETALSS
jgi:hypothetical protein|tara:strand:+ start:59 stop:214 length:156 start_codon:yes stop_codon:yes gene_type:complete